MPSGLVHVRLGYVQWVVLGYLLAISTLTMMVGRLGDMIGKKPLYAVGFVILTLGSALCLTQSGPK